MRLGDLSTFLDLQKNYIPVFPNIAGWKFPFYTNGNTSIQMVDFPASDVIVYGSVSEVLEGMRGKLYISTCLWMQKIWKFFLEVNKKQVWLW